MSLALTRTFFPPQVDVVVLMVMKLPGNGDDVEEVSDFFAQNPLRWIYCPFLEIFAQLYDVAVVAVATPG